MFWDLGQLGNLLVFCVMGLVLIFPFLSHLLFSFFIHFNCNSHRVVVELDGLKIEIII